MLWEHCSYMYSYMSVLHDINLEETIVWVLNMQVCSIFTKTTVEYLIDVYFMIDR